MTLCHKCGFLPNKDICDVFENLPELGNSLQEDTKWKYLRLLDMHVAKIKELMVYFFYYERYSSFVKVID